MPDQLEELAAGRETAVVLAAPWHERDARALVERLGVSVFAPPPGSAEVLMEKYGLTREQAGDGSPDLAWLRTGDVGEAHWYSAGDQPLAGVQAFPSRDENEVVLWVEGYRAVIAGDTLVDFGEGLEIPVIWLREGVTREQVAEGPRPLLELPVEHVLATHGGAHRPGRPRARVVLLLDRSKTFPARSRTRPAPRPVALQSGRRVGAARAIQSDLVLPVLAARAAAVVMLGIAAFQIALVLGAPWGAYTQGGETEGALDTSGRAFAAVSCAILLVMAAAILARVREGPLENAPGRLVTSLSWFTAVYSALAVVLNLATQSSSERAVFAPIAILLFALVVTAMVGSRRTS